MTAQQFRNQGGLVVVALLCLVFSLVGCQAAIEDPPIELEPLQWPDGQYVEPVRRQSGDAVQPLHLETADGKILTLHGPQTSLRWSPVAEHLAHWLTLFDGRPGDGYPALVVMQKGRDVSLHPLGEFRTVPAHWLRSLTTTLDATLPGDPKVRGASLLVPEMWLGEAEDPLLYRELSWNELTDAWSLDPQEGVGRFVPFLAGDYFLLRFEPAEGSIPEEGSDAVLEQVKQLIEHPCWLVDTPLKGADWDAPSDRLVLTFQQAWWDESGDAVEVLLDSLAFTVGQWPDVREIALRSTTPPDAPLHILAPKAAAEWWMNWSTHDLGSPESSIQMSAVGDVIPARAVLREIEAHGEDFPLAYAREIFLADDLTFINLEAPLAQSGEPLPGKLIWFRGNPETVPALRRAGVDVINLANNHILDYGRPAFVETLTHLRRYGYLPIGAGMNETEAHEPLIWEGKGVRVAFLGYTEYADIFWDWRHPETFAAGPDLPGVASLVGEAMQRDVELIRDQVNQVIVSAHWGPEYIPQPPSHHVDLARSVLDAGADMIIGHHPHVLQSVEVWDDKPVLYSLGNFVFDQRPLPRRQTVIAQIELSVRSDRSWLEEIRFLPYLIHEGQPRPAEDEDADVILSHLEAISRERGTHMLIRDGHLFLPLARAE